ncbi:Uncharacterised protein [Bordetella pseudohinzii]|uniref:DUF6896 domain-containing protein n=3 Tax=Bordetella pseudohinzii TaxID=1331258 RepID=A0A0M7F5W2_9BORD|nr:Uncharacterised protein [Bordetella pseudohinzii]
MDGMDKNLTDLIRDYQASVRTAVEIMHKSGIPLPATCSEWIETDVPGSGELEGSIRYLKHGYGCKVWLPSGSIDFDFGRFGEINGFDEWRLISFAGSRMAEYGFETLDAFKESFKTAVQSGSVVYSGYILYYVAGSARSLAIEVRDKFPNDSLPNRDGDHVMALYAHCYLAADLMRMNYEKLWQKYKKNDRLNVNDRVNLRIYLSSWLGYLFETCEGFGKLNMRSLLTDHRPTDFHELIPQADDINGLIKRHWNSLRKFRNNVFHLRSDIKDVVGFFADDGERLAWAAEIHATIAKFLSDYRVLCEVRYVMQGRSSEGQLRSRPRRWQG